MVRCGQPGVGKGAIRIAREAALEGDGTGDRIKRIDGPMAIVAAIRGGAVVEANAVSCGQRGGGIGAISAREEGLTGGGIRNRAGNRDIDRINQPRASLPKWRRQIRAPAEGHAGPGGFHKAAIATGRAAPHAQQASHLRALVGIGHHRAPIALCQRIGAHRAGPIHSGGAGVGHCRVGAVGIAAQQHRAPAGRAAGIKGGPR